MSGSELGSVKFWEERYKEENDNFKSFGDEGEIWFGEENQKIILKWINEIINQNFKSNVKILDIGTGNGLFLISLSSLGYRDLTGIDYSDNGIKFAIEISKQRNCQHIKYIVDDILDTKLREKYDVIFDKGTFDAIELTENNKINKKKYIDEVSKLIFNDGLFVVTSCNSTNDELIEDFKDKFEYFNKIDNYPKFTFGGVEGSKISTVAFKLKI